MANQTSSAPRRVSNVIPFRRPQKGDVAAPTTRPRRRYTKKSDREILVCCIEEHICQLERAVHSIARVRTLVEDLKAQEGWTWKF